MLLSLDIDTYSPARDALAALPIPPPLPGLRGGGLQVRVGFEIEYLCPAPTPMLLALSIHYTRANDLLIPDLLQTEPPVAVDTYRDAFGNWCSRIIAPQGRLVLRTDALVHDTGLPDVVLPAVQQLPVEQLPEAVLMYLLGSRYCETDQLSDMAWLQFGNGPTGWARVQAICDFVHQHIEFGYHHARRTRTALEAYREGQGVCRDYAHLAIALCRCMNIPARYCTGYLGDIRSPVVPGPMDFAAWFEAYLGGDWYTFDARNNTPRVGRVLMARGRDACDVALANTFGPNTLQRFTVWADEVLPSL
ncbi:transglutaminase family protein [Rhodoferax saidenbachensis]|uniref:Transglutaminase-like putative cysteine protease n=1 Tax=Rhodoferax saidenbachensis TaxID=1484693 RepID=A0ABU1ZMD4_9BURK|nr:transglutaminase family protein [Rhodoferax saidenbachensis]MDR7306116.1 transglutaminase-like putative cysteine protease [Rhodoferax saidenbachensis]